MNKQKRPDELDIAIATVVKSAQIAILRELLESGPKMPKNNDPWAVDQYAFGREDMANEWRDHITAKIKELEGAGE